MTTIFSRKGSKQRPLFNIQEYSYIDDHLTWKERVKHTISKANTSRAFLQGNIVSCPRAVKDACYKIMIHPIIEYAAIIWSPHTQSLISKLKLFKGKQLGSYVITIIDTLVYLRFYSNQGGQLWNTSALRPELL